MVTRSVNIVRKISTRNIKVCKLEILLAHLFLMSKFKQPELSETCWVIKIPLEQILQLWLHFGIEYNDHTAKPGASTLCFGWTFLHPGLGFSRAIPDDLDGGRSLPFKRMLLLSHFVAFVLQCGAFHGP